MRSYWIQVGGLLLAGTLIRLGIAPLGGHPGDLPVLSQWADAMHRSGWMAVYARSSANYPPLGLLLIGGMRGLLGLIAPQAVAGTAGLWPVLLKLPAIVADAGMGGLVAYLARERRGGLWLVASVVVHPALIQMSAWWGQLDSVYVLLVFGAVLAALRERPLWAGALLGLGVMVKLQALLIAPAVVAIFLQENRAGRDLGLASAGLAAGLLPLLPFILTGQTQLVLKRLVAVAAGPGWPTINALNLWYVVTGGVGNWAFDAPLLQSDASLLIAGIPARTFGAVLLAGWTVSVLWLGWRARSARGWLLAGALLYVGLLAWPTQAHERYALAAVILLAGVAALRGPCHEWYAPGVYAIISSMQSVNLLWAAPPFGWLSPGFAGNRATGIVVACLQLLAGAWAWWLLARERSEALEA